MDAVLQEKIDHRKLILNKLKQMLIDRLNLYQKEEDIDDDSILFGTGLRLDSVDATEIVAILDLVFGIKNEDGIDPTFMRTVNSMTDFVLANAAPEKLKPENWEQ